MDNHHDLIVDCRGTQATDSGDHQKTIATDKNNVSAVFGLHVIAYNLIRLANLLLAQPSPQE
jgi:hypothetical protein